MPRPASLPNDASATVLRFPSRLQADIKTADNLKYMRGLNDESMHLIITSPPYNLGKTYESKRSQDIYLEDQAAAIAEAVRLLHPKGSICWQVGNHVDDGQIFPLDILLYPLFRNHGLKSACSSDEFAVRLKMGSAYHFHIWDMKTGVLHERTGAEVAPHIPGDQGNGKWSRVEIRVGATKFPSAQTIEGATNP